MCGIAGFIGESKKPPVSYQLTTKLFEKIESRGVDAAGFWGTDPGPGGRIFYHKEPGRSTQFVKKGVWRKVGETSPNLLLLHARAASKGVGEPCYNKNNHPFVSEDRSIGLVHNGRIEPYEYDALTQKYEVKSDCDSEILLRLFESGISDQTLSGIENPDRMAGIRDIFSHINDGHMAVATGERLANGGRSLWIFRNRHRPLWVVDMRESLGQIFFASECRIWEEAVRECPSVRQISHAARIIELPPGEIWYFSLKPEKMVPEKVQRFEVCKERSTRPWVFDGQKRPITPAQPVAEVVGKLDENDEPKRKKSSDLTLAAQAQAISDAAFSIVTAATNLELEGSITAEEVRIYIEKMESVKRQLFDIMSNMP